MINQRKFGSPYKAMQILKINHLQIIERIGRVGKRALDIRKIHHTISRWLAVDELVES